VVAGRGDRHAPRRAEQGAIAEFADDNDLVLTWPVGRPLHPDLITDWFQRHARRVVWDQDGRKRVGLPVIRLHDVRHSYATAALAAGIPAKVVSERLGTPTSSSRSTPIVTSSRAWTSTRRRPSCG
jgi:integrase